MAKAIRMHQTGTPGSFLFFLVAFGPGYLEVRPVVDGVVTCPLHGLRWNVKTGARVAPPASSKPIAATAAAGFTIGTEQVFQLCEQVGGRAEVTEVFVALLFCFSGFLAHF